MEDLFKKLESGHEYVDLGLSVKWAAFNIGQNGMYEFGEHFAWGDNKDEYENMYEWKDYKFLHPKSHPLFSKYNTDPEFGPVDNLTRLELQDDVAAEKWGGPWRMPTAAEFKELIEKCSCEWVFYQKDRFEATDGFLFISKVPGYEGNFIFLPSCGLLYDHTMDEKQEHYNEECFYGDCFYWTSDLIGDKPSTPEYACMFFADKSPLGNCRPRLEQEKRFVTSLIRPVFK